MSQRIQLPQASMPPFPPQPSSSKPGLPIPYSSTREPVVGSWEVGRHGAVMQFGPHPRGRGEMWVHRDAFPFGRGGTI